MVIASDAYTFDERDFVLRDRGRKYEDFRVGQTFEHHWGRTIDQSDNSTFCAATCNWNPLYLNRVFAIANGHPDCPVSPALVICVVVGLTVEDLSETAGPFLGMSKCVFDRSVYPGDTLTAKSAVLSCRESTSRAGLGVVTWQTQGENQRGEAVVSFVRSNLVEMRSHSTRDASFAFQGEGVSS
jgi:itaconyl-CoA hydratase